MRLAVTGAAGFIGSAFVRAILSRGEGAEVLALDSLTYAGNLENLRPVANSPGFGFERLDIRDREGLRRSFETFRPEVVVHCAAESHVDRSILSPADSVATNVLGTAVLLDVAREHNPKTFLHVSTDEVYGSIDAPDVASENAPLSPTSPYSASKAGADHLVLAYGKTFSLPVIVSRATNNYGPYQFPEKLIPLIVSNALRDLPLPVYGDGLQVRDWLHVDDHCRAIDALIARGQPGSIYNVGGGSPISNMELVRSVLRICGKPESLIQHVPDRPGHDRRYAVSSERLRDETGWAPSVDFDDGLRSTVEWYRRNPGWVQRVRSGEYLRYYERNYAARGLSLPR